MLQLTISFFFIDPTKEHYFLKCPHFQQWKCILLINICFNLLIKLTYLLEQLFIYSFILQCFLFSLKQFHFWNYEVCVKVFSKKKTFYNCLWLSNKCAGNTVTCLVIRCYYCQEWWLLIRIRSSLMFYHWL